MNSEMEETPHIFKPSIEGQSDQTAAAEVDKPQEISVATTTAPLAPIDPLGFELAHLEVPPIEVKGQDQNLEVDKSKEVAVSSFPLIEEQASAPIEDPFGSEPVNHELLPIEVEGQDQTLEADKSEQAVISSFLFMKEAAPVKRPVDFELPSTSQVITTTATNHNCQNLFDETDNSTSSTIVVKQEEEIVNEFEEEVAEEYSTIRIVGVNSLQEIQTDDVENNCMTEEADSSTVEAEYLSSILEQQHQQNESGTDNQVPSASASLLITKTKTDWRKGNQSHKRKLSHIMRTPGRNQDVVFIVGETKEEIPAHSFILWLNSNVFEEILRTQVNELGNKMKEIVVEDVTPEVFKIILKFMYTEEMENITTENVHAVYKAAKKNFGIFELADYCLEIIKNYISLENAVKILQLAQEFEETELYQVALFFIFQNGETVLRSEEFLVLSRENLSEILGSDHLAASEITVFQAAGKWATNHCFLNDQKPSPENLRLALDEVIYKIRFPLMTAEGFKVDVLPTNILQPTEMIALFSYFTPPFGNVPPDFPFSTTPRLQPEEEMSVSNLEMSQGSQDNNVARSSRGRIRRTTVVKEEEKEEEEVISVSSASSNEFEETVKIDNRKKSHQQQKQVKGPTTKNKRGPGRPPKKLKSNSDSEDDWKKSSESSKSDSSDEDYVAPSSVKLNNRKRSRTIPQILPIRKAIPYRSVESTFQTVDLTTSKSPKSQSLFQSIIPRFHGLKNFKVSPIESPNMNELSSFIRKLILMNGKQIITSINEDLVINSLPTHRVCLPNIKNFCLNLTSPRLQNVTDVTVFKEVAIPLLKNLQELIFFGRSETRSGKIPSIELKQLWTSGCKFNLTFNRVNVFKCDEETGDLVCCFVRNPALPKIMEGLIYKRHPLKRLTIAECEFRMLSAIPSNGLRVLTVLKVSGLDGINQFLQRCSNLRELYWDGNGVGYRIITLDEDLNLFSKVCNLRKLVISNALVSLKNPFAQTESNMPAKVTFPLFFFCEFCPNVIENFQKIFPYVNQIHFRNYPMLKFFEKLVELEYLVDIGIWGAKLITLNQVNKSNSVNFISYLGHQDLRAKIRQESVHNKIGKFGNHAFFLKKKPPTQTTTALRWEVTETVRNPTTDSWDDDFLRQIYSSFQYSTILDFGQYKNLFRCNY